MDVAEDVEAPPLAERFCIVFKPTCRDGSAVGTPN